MLPSKLPRKLAEDPPAKEPGRRIYVPRPKEPQITPRDLFGLATRLVGLYFMVRALISLLDFAVRFIPQRELSGSGPILLIALLNGGVSLYFILGAWPISDWAYPNTPKTPAETSVNDDDLGDS